MLDKNEVLTDPQKLVRLELKNKGFDCRRCERVNSKKYNQIPTRKPLDNRRRIQRNLGTSH